VLEAGGSHQRAFWASSGAVEATAAAKARIFSGSFTPGRTSVPLAVSTANGDVAAIASATFDGLRPPLRMNGVEVRR
jgi:anti-sigma-K factor RskA